MNMGDLMKQAQQFQERLATVQNELAGRQVSGSAGAGMVTATLNGKGELLTLVIEPELVRPENTQMVQDLVVAAVNDGLHKAQELGMRMRQVYARGTSRFAYDGSGKVTRSKENAQLATFATGKRYNADLNGALNIAARGLAMILGIKPKDNQAVTGKSSGAVERMPLVLADIWAHAQIPRGASNRQATPVGSWRTHLQDAPTTASCDA